MLLSFIWSITFCDVILSSRHSERGNSRHGWLVPESHYVRVMLASFRDAGTTKELAQWWSSFGIYQNPWPQDKALILISLLVGKTHLTYICHCLDFQYSRSYLSEFNLPVRKCRPNVTVTLFLADIIIINSFVAMFCNKRVPIGHKANKHGINLFLNDAENNFVSSEFPFTLLSVEWK